MTSRVPERLVAHAMTLKWREVFKFLSGAALAGSFVNLYLWLAGICAVSRLCDHAASARGEGGRTVRAERRGIALR